MSGSSFIKRAAADFERSSAFIASACADAGGWALKIHDAEKTASRSVLVYAWDSATKWLWSCSIPCEAFAKLSGSASQQGPTQIDEIRGALGMTIWHAATGTEPGPDFQDSLENALGSLAALYAGTTRVWEVAGRLQDGGHFIVIYYRNPARRVGNLRPFIMPASASVRGQDILPVNELLDLIDTVSRMDRKQHPEWFK